MTNVLRQYGRHLRPFLAEVLADRGPLGADPADIQNDRLREFVLSDVVAERYVRECCPPAGRGRLWAAPGFSLSPLDDLEQEYTLTEQADSLFARRLLQFAVAGDGSGYCLDLESGGVTRMEVVWTDAELDLTFENRIDTAWPDLRSFVAHLRAERQAAADEAAGAG